MDRSNERQGRDMVSSVCWQCLGNGYHVRVRVGE